MDSDRGNYKSTQCLTSCQTIEESLHFEDFTIDSISHILPYLKDFESNTCDFSIGGIYMWIDYFKYKYCIVNDTLFIMGREEDDTSKVAFSVPVGAMPFRQAIELVRRYCEQNKLPMVFSAVPDAYLERFKSLSPRLISDLPHWADYLYSAQELATLSGKKFSKKRNHVNKFNSLYPQAIVEPITYKNIATVKEFYKSLEAGLKDDPMAQYEYRQVGRILSHIESFNFISMALQVDGKVVSFMIGEIINDTLHAHIEKTNHEYDGASEYINNRFINYALSLYPALLYENREDDAGDEGLRKSKLSYNPITMLKKYNIIF
ncbi:MAG: phosphatidylglycerol lysyltransferase domain-containing protein [Muribaculaceae bacterium]|nr:phosphatidylglycerol lysyltransferase domain-containing protein [Muribaculaceae bacterium]